MAILLVCLIGKSRCEELLKIWVLRARFRDTRRPLKYLITYLKLQSISSIRLVFSNPVISYVSTKSHRYSYLSSEILDVGDFGVLQFYGKPLTGICGSMNFVTLHNRKSSRRQRRELTSRIKVNPLPLSTQESASLLCHSS